MAQKRGESAMGGKKSKSKAKHSSVKKPHELHIRKSANGGYIAKHVHKATAGAEPPEAEEHTLPDVGALQQHVGEHMAPDEEAAGGAAPQGTPQGGMPQMPGM